MVKRARIFALAVALCLLGAVPAHAAFAPDLTVGLDAPTAGGSPALTAMITQPATDTAIERFTLHLPAGFSPAGAPGAASCAVATVRVGACPAATRIGAAGMLLSPTVGSVATIHKTGPDDFAMRLSFLAGTVVHVVEGSVIQRADGSLDMKLDQLPALPMTRLALRFYGGPLSLFRTPDQCGGHTIDGKFTSRRGDLAIDRTVVSIVGCPGVPAVQVANVRFSDRRFKAGGSRSGYRTIIAWWASRAVDHTNVRVERRVHGAWRVLGVLVATANEGDNRVRWDGRLKDRALKAGRYGIRIHPAGSAPAKLVRFRILR
jgi:hypothetical protein